MHPVWVKTQYGNADDFKDYAGVDIQSQPNFLREDLERPRSIRTEIPPFQFPGIRRAKPARTRGSWVGQVISLVGMLKITDERPHGHVLATHELHTRHSPRNRIAVPVNNWFLT